MIFFTLVRVHNHTSKASNFLTCESTFIVFQISSITNNHSVKGKVATKMNACDNKFTAKIFRQQQKMFKHTCHTSDRCKQVNKCHNGFHHPESQQQYCWKCIQSHFQTQGCMPHKCLTVVIVITSI